MTNHIFNFISHHDSSQINLQIESFISSLILNSNFVSFISTISPNTRVTGKKKEKVWITGNEEKVCIKEEEKMTQQWKKRYDAVAKKKRDAGKKKKSETATKKKKREGDVGSGISLNLTKRVWNRERAHLHQTRKPVFLHHINGFAYSDCNETTPSAPLPSQPHNSPN